MAKNDSRIKIINNDKNYGLLYSRAIGIINCKGEYILNLDPDDELQGPDNLEILYKYANQSKIDILSFGSFYKRNKKKIFKCSNFDIIYTQPRIFESAFNSAYNLKDFLIWNKLIKRDIFLKAYEMFKPKIYGEKWNYHEDNIWSVLVHKYAKTMKCINKIIYIYNNYRDSLMKKRYDLMELKNIIYRHEMYKIIFTSKKGKKYLFAEYLEIISFLGESENFFKLLKKNIEIRNKLLKIFIDFKKTYNLKNKTKIKVANFLEKIYKN